MPDIHVRINNEPLNQRIRIRIRITLFHIKFLKLQTLAVSYLSMKSLLLNILACSLIQTLNGMTISINWYLKVQPKLEFLEP